MRSPFESDQRDEYADVRTDNVDLPLASATDGSSREPVHFRGWFQEAMRTTSPTEVTYPTLWHQFSPVFGTSRRGGIFPSHSGMGPEV